MKLNATIVFAFLCLNIR